MKWGQFIADYLTFTRKDRIGILVLIGLILIVFFLPKLFLIPAHLKSPVFDTTVMSSAKNVDQTSPTAIEEKNNDDNYSYQYDRSKRSEENSIQGELFPFDPNTLPISGWKKLGLKDKIIHTIQNYLDKGGHFKKPEDLQKVYGLHRAEYEKLVPYVKINATGPKEISKSPTPYNFKPPAAKYSVIDINTADTFAFVALPGIGSKLAARIVNFRDKLGGFYSISQIGETYGLPDSTFEKIKPYLKLENTVIKKININSATVDELRAHPYIKWNLANPIVAYRKEHGPFLKIEEIKKIMSVTDEAYNKLAPYLTL